MKRTRKLALRPQKLRSKWFLTPDSGLTLCLVLFWVGLAVSETPNAARAESPYAGPLFDEFDLTLAPGHRTEALGPCFYWEQKEARRTWAVPPLLSSTQDPETESEKIDFLFPVMTYDRYGEQYRWQLFQLLSFAGGPTQQESVRDRFTLFPLYFQQRSSDTNQNYTAVCPFYGHLKNRLFRDDIFFVLFPAYSETRQKDVVTDNYGWPFFDLRHGNGLRGWQLWPVVGNEHKDITTETNGFGEVKTIGGHDSFFALWPLYFNATSGIGTTNVERQQASIPAYCRLRSPLRDSTTVLWPFFNHVEDREKKCREWDAPWPFVVFARGEGKTTTRVWPFYSRAHSDELESGFYLWPVYKRNRLHSAPLDSRRTRICFFLFSELTEKNTETGASRQRTYCLPFFTRRRDFDGSSRLQVLALLEPFFSASKSVEREYSPVWSVWRAERNPRAGAASQSLLWNLYRREATPAAKKCSLLFGLFQYQSSPEGNRMRLFYIPLGRANPPAHGGANPAPAKTG